MKVVVKRNVVNKQRSEIDINEMGDAQKVVYDILCAVRSKLLQSKVGDFGIICMQTTLKLQYKGEIEYYKNIEMSTNLKFNEYFSYSFELENGNCSNKEEIADKICKSILLALYDIECSLTFYDKSAKRFSLVKELFDKLQENYHPLVDGEHLKRNLSLFCKSKENAEFFFGNEFIRFQYVDGEIMNLIGEYARSLLLSDDERFITYKGMICQLITEWSGELELSWGNVIQFVKGDVVIVIHPFTYLIDNSIDIKKYVDSLSELIYQKVIESCKKEEPEVQVQEPEKLEQKPKVSKQVPEIWTQSLREDSKCFLFYDIYCIVDGNKLPLATDVAKHLIGKATENHLACQELCGKWFHLSITEVESCIKEMIHNRYLNADYGYSKFPDEPYALLKVNNPYPNPHTDNPIDKIMSDDLERKVEALIKSMVEGQDAIKEFCKTLVVYKDMDVREMILGKLRGSSFNAGFFYNELFLELLHELVRQ